MDYMEFSAKTVDDAITKACEHFQVPSTSLDYDVTDHGSSGFLGIGARDAKIKAKVKTEEEIVEEERIKEEEIKAKELQEKRIKEAEEFNNKENTVDPDEYLLSDDSPEVSDIKGSAITKEESSNSVNHGRHERRNRYESGNRSRHSRYSHNNSRKNNITYINVEEKNGVKVFLDSMFKAMHMEVDIELKYAEEERILDIDFSGESMGILIGKRGQTLDAIQYLSSLVVNKGEEDYIHVKVDTENYRKRRKDTLENLAKNISFKVKRSRRPVSLEPMNPYERRIIHSALQNDRYVTTYSEGNEPYRRVVVAPKVSARNGDF